MTRQCALSGILLASAALARKESRGVHSRNDFSEQSGEFNCSIRLRKADDGIKIERIPR